MNELSKAIIRLLVTFILVLNAGLTAKGLNPIPFDEATVTDVLTQVFAGGAIIWSWWKNNNVTKKAQNDKTITSKINSGELTVHNVEEVSDPEDTVELEAEYGKEDE